MGQRWQADLFTYQQLTYASEYVQLLWIWKLSFISRLLLSEAAYFPDESSCDSDII